MSVNRRGRREHGTWHLGATAVLRNKQHVVLPNREELFRMINRVVSCMRGEKHLHCD